MKSRLIEDLQRLEKDNKVNQAKEDLAILKVYNSNKTEKSNIKEQEPIEGPALDLPEDTEKIDYNNILKEFIAESPNISKKMGKKEELESSFDGAVRKDLNSESLKVEQTEVIAHPGVDIEDDSEEIMLEVRNDVNEDILDEFFRVEEVKTSEPQETKLEEIVSSGNVHVKHDSDRKGAVKIKETIDSFLDLLLSKNGTAMKIDSHGSMMFLIEDGKVEKETNALFDQKNVFSFADYILNKNELSTFQGTKVHLGIYTHKDDHFHTLYLQESDRISIHFLHIKRYEKVFSEVIKDLPLEKISNDYRGVINVISGFKEEFAIDFSKAISSYLTGDTGSIFLVYEENLFDFPEEKFMFSAIPISTLKHESSTNLFDVTNGIIFFNVELSDENLNIILDTAFKGRNVYLLLKNNNNSAEIIEYLLSIIERPSRKKLFVKFLNSVISLNVLDPKGNVPVPIYDFVYLDKKLKRHLLDEKFEIFYNNLDSDNQDSVISFSKSVERLLSEGKVSRRHIDNFLKNFSSKME